ncbi:3'(2'),5'-bisphosphate nucleotidase CysQ [Pacificispira spongiicola]|uniref:3'(2'),5'-bisphosphate nucleotidase CysQ n=1 Tax=Pacificispira spongiicola TaxID=2729598 RepID=UPI0029C9E42E|nr:3'(2'),5'-bisphosphate nucleotidase CysQ [Pacificispira spongiicola]
MTSTQFDTAALLPTIQQVARDAGAKIMAIYATDFEHRTKDDASPVTEADEAAEAIIVPILEKLTPGVAVVAEEAATTGRIPDVGNGPFWLVDPLDGTKEFLKRNGEFTVNIALIENNAPVLGVVYLPALSCLYSGIVGKGAWRQDKDGPETAIAVRPEPADGLTVIGSRSHGDASEMEAFLAPRRIAETVSAGSSLKFCRVAEGAADVYPRLGRTMEWDVAAGHAVLAAAGGTVTLTDGTPFTYAKNPIFENPHFVAWGGVRP